MGTVDHWDQLGSILSVEKNNIFIYPSIIYMAYPEGVAGWLAGANPRDQHRRHTTIQAHIHIYDQSALIPPWVWTVGGSYPETTHTDDGERANWLWDNNANHDITTTYIFYFITMANKTQPHRAETGAFHHCQWWKDAVAKQFVLQHIYTLDSTLIDIIVIITGVVWLSRTVSKRKPQQDSIKWWFSCLTMVLFVLSLFKAFSLRAGLIDFTRTQIYPVLRFPGLQLQLLSPRSRCFGARESSASRLSSALKSFCATSLSTFPNQ